MGNDNTHKNHRNRMRAKFHSSEDTIADHELLEIFLFCAYAQRNTNFIAHDLLDKCGSLEKVFKADPDTLTSVKYVGEGTAGMLRIQGKLLEQYKLSAEREKEGLQLTPKNAGRYLVTFFEGYCEEITMLFMLNSDCRIIRKIPLAKGDFNYEHSYIKNVIRYAMENHASYLLIASNKPKGIDAPSNKETSFILELEQALNFINVRLVDNIVVCRSEYISLAEQFNVYKP